MPLLYEGLDEESACEIQNLDNEVQAIKRKINQKYPSVDLAQVIPIKQRLLTMYKGQISDTSSLKRIFNTNKGYSGIPFPMVPVKGQDLNSIP